MHNLLQDLRYALRTLRKNWPFTLAVVLTLSVGIGANTLVFSVVESVLVRPLPYAQPDRLAMVWEKHPSFGQLELSYDAPMAAASLLQSAVRELDPNQPIESIQSLEQVLSASLAKQKLSAIVMAAFSFIALVLAAIGIYGMMAYQVTQRRREIAIRMALGAGRGDVLQLVVGHGMRLAGIGAAAGVLIAVAVGRMIANQLYEVRPVDPSTYLLVGTALLTVAFVAVYVPSRRAANEDPASVLKWE